MQDPLAVLCTLLPPRVKLEADLIIYVPDAGHHVEIFPALWSLSQLHSTRSHGKQTPAQSIPAVGGEQEHPWDTTANIHVIPWGLSDHDMHKSLGRGGSYPLASVPVAPCRRRAQKHESQGKGTTPRATLPSAH